MLTSDSYKPEAMVRTLHRTLGGDGDPWMPTDWQEPGGDRIVYLGAGYWRAQLVLDADSHFRGVRLINPDFAASEIRKVEEGLAILLHFHYLPLY